MQKKNGMGDCQTVAFIFRRILPDVDDLMKKVEEHRGKTASW